MAAAAAEASTTTALAFFRLVTFRTGIIKFSYRVTVFRVYVRRTWVVPLPCVVFIVVPSNAARVCDLTLYLNNTVGLHPTQGFRVVIILHASYEKLLSVTFLDAT